MVSDTEHLSYPAYSYYDATQPYTLNNYNTINYDYSYPKSQAVAAPETYNVNNFRTPISFKESDQNWVTSQNPQGYTIELAEGDKASKVAQVLYKTPKNNRTAQVQYERDGKTYYKGVYGSYGTATEAQKALNGLPPEIRNSASVVHWGSVQ